MTSPPNGGFLAGHDLLTPPPSSVASSIANQLPQPRKHPLKPGGPKESSLIRYLDQAITATNRRWAKRRFRDEDAGDVKGYHSFKEAGKDIDGLIDVVWVSGTPNIQVSYLLHIALMVADFLPTFPASPKTTFHILDKLDHAFASLLQGKDLDTGDALPGFENGNMVSTTERIRIKSVAERTRCAVVAQMSAGDLNPDPIDGAELMETEDEDDEDEDDDMEVEDNLWEAEIARIYERTLTELGDELTADPIGIITED